MKKMFIGIYRLCDMVTLTGTLFTIAGLMFVFNKHNDLAVICLGMSAICDALDGKLARKRKNTEEENIYGAELDSLSDVMSFGLFPAIIMMSLIDYNLLTYAILVFYVIAGVIRLAYYNTLSISKKGDSRYFIGVPITTIAIIFPILYFVNHYFPFAFFDELALGLFMLVGILFISRIKIKKLSDTWKNILCLVGVICIIVLLIVML